MREKSGPCGPPSVRLPVIFYRGAWLRKLLLRDKSGTGAVKNELTTKKGVKPVKPNLLILLVELNGIELSTS